MCAQSIMQMKLNYSLFWIVSIILYFFLCPAIASGKFTADGEVAAVTTFKVKVNAEAKFPYEIFVCRKESPAVSVYGKSNMWFSQPSFSPDGGEIAFYTYPIPDYSQQDSIIATNLSIQILDLESMKMRCIFRKEIEGIHFLPLLSPFGQWVPQWSADGNNIYASVPFGQTSSGIKYNIWKIDVISETVTKLPISDGTHPVVSSDGKWLFYCKIPKKETIGAYRDVSCYIQYLNANKSSVIKLPSAVIEEPLRVIFSRDSQTLAILGLCNIGTVDWPVIEPCLEFFKIRHNQWVLIKRVTLKDLQKYIQKSVSLKKEVKLELFACPSLTFGFSLSPDGQRFTILAYTRNKGEDIPEEIFVCIVELPDISESKVIYKTCWPRQVWDVFLLEGKLSILECSKELQDISLKMITLPRIK